MKKLFIANLLIIIMVMGSFEICRPYANTIDKINILYITEKTSFTADNSFILINNTESVDTSSYCFIIIDKELMNENSKVALQVHIPAHPDS